VEPLELREPLDSRTAIRGGLLSIQAMARRLARGRIRGLRELALTERVDVNSASVRIAKFVHFHRAAELFLGRRVTPHPIIRAAIAHAPPDEELCSKLAIAASNDATGAAWGNSLYEMLFAARDRRKRGEFFTPVPIARVMAAWTLRNGDERVLDPCTGPGTLLAAAHTRLSELGCKDTSEQLQGVELSPLARTFASLALAPSLIVPNINQADFLTSFRGRRGTFDAIIANPPYSRHQSLDATYKGEIADLTDKILRVRTNRRAGIHLHFLARALELLRVGGRLAFLTSRELLDAQYGAALRAYLLSSSKLRALVLFDSKVLTFDGVLTTSAITFLERGVPDRSSVRIVDVKMLPSAEELMTAIVDADPRSFTWGRSLNVEHIEIERAAKWSTLVAVKEHAQPDNGLVPLGELVTAKRGIATGANRFFLLSSAEASAAGLRSQSLRAAIGRARLSKGARITKRDFRRWEKRGERVWLLDIRDRPSPEEEEYLNFGVEQGLPRRFLCRARKCWYQMERREPPPILATYMSRTGLRFFQNSAELVPLNVFHGLYPKGLTNAQVGRLLECLNAEDFRSRVSKAARSYGGGLLKVEPRELLAVPIADVRKV
jgi:adenine-specific DNA-methyltransferase